MRPTPSRLGVEALLLTLDTFPTEIMQTIIVWVDRLDEMIRFAIASLTTANLMIH